MVEKFRQEANNALKADNNEKVALIEQLSLQPNDGDGGHSSGRLS